MQPENRYSRQLRRNAFALRLIRLNARTQTIITWSGMSTYRIRTLYRAGGTDQIDAGRRRPRGRPPHQVNFFWRFPKRANEAATLAGIARLLNAIPAHSFPEGAELDRRLQQGEGVCAAYELLHAYIPNSEISIDHAFLLVTALARGDEVQIGLCVACEGLILVDCLKPPRQTCVFCSSITGNRSGTI